MKNCMVPSRFHFMSINNNSKLAFYHIKSQEYRESVAATKANNVSTWKVVYFACLSTGEFHLVATCDLEVIKYPDHVGSIDIIFRSWEFYLPCISV